MSYLAGIGHFYHCALLRPALQLMRRGHAADRRAAGAWNDSVCLPAAGALENLVCLPAAGALENLVWLAAAGEKKDNTHGLPAVQ